MHRDGQPQPRGQRTSNQPPFLRFEMDPERRFGAHLGQFVSDESCLVGGVGDASFVTELFFVVQWRCCRRLLKGTDYPIPTCRSHGHPSLPTMESFGIRCKVEFWASQSRPNTGARMFPERRVRLITRRALQRDAVYGGMSDINSVVYHNSQITRHTLTVDCSSKPTYLHRCRR